ncbi:hypothetical protein ACQR3P_04085 [Rhodococcus sp. IEGM1300]
MVKKILAFWQAYSIASSRQILIPNVAIPSRLLMVHELPAGKGIQVTALNFVPEPITEDVHLPGISHGVVIDMINEREEAHLTEAGRMIINLIGYEGVSLRIVRSTPSM